MLSGNPDTFAIWCDSVDSWSSGRFKNGCFGYIIGGKLIWSTRSTLTVDLEMLSRLHCMSHAVEDDNLFRLPVTEAYIELCSRAFPAVDSDVESIDFTHLVSAESLSDDGYYVFLVESAGQAKLIYGFKENYDNIIEILLSYGEFQGVVNTALQKFTRL